MNVALYTRVSSDKQDTDLSISAQLKALRSFAGAHDHTVVREFVDEAESGRTTNRPVFQEMIRLAKLKPPPFEAVLVYKWSRFTRNREDSIIYKSLLRKLGIEVMSIHEPVENTPTGRMMEGIIEVLDEFYSANLGQEVTRGMRESASRGFWVSSSTPYGYKRKKVDDGGKHRAKLVVDSDKAPVVRRIFDMASSGQGCKEIASALNAEDIPSPGGKRWGKGRIHVILTNETYTGTLIWGAGGKYHREAKLDPVRVEGAFPALVNRAKFDRVGELLRDRSPKVTPSAAVGSRYLLSGLARCGACGVSIFGHGAKSGRYHYYVCSTAHRSGRDQCTTRPVPMDLLEDQVLAKVVDLVLREEHVEELVRLTNDELEASLGELSQRMTGIDAQLADIDGRLGRLYDALETGSLDHHDLAPRIKDLREKRDLILRHKSEVNETLTTGRVELVSRETVLGYLKDLKWVLGHGTVSRAGRSCATWRSKGVPLGGQCSA